MESYDGQIENEARLSRLIVEGARAVKCLAGCLPGTYVLAVGLRETKEARITYADAHEEIVRLTLEAAPKLKDNETVNLSSERLPFTVQLHRRHGNSSQVFVHCLVEGDGDQLRLERMRRALDDKCPKLAVWAADGRESILVLQAYDIQLSNYLVAYKAFEQAITERKDQPDIVVFVENDGGPMYGWMFKEGHRFGDDIPMPSSSRCYTEGRICSADRLDHTRSLARN